MKKQGIEKRVTIIAILIVVAVIISGYLVHRSLTQIVSSIQTEASPDFRLIVIKNIALDVLEIENNLEVYSISKSKSDIANYENVKDRLKGRVMLLTELSSNKGQNPDLSDSIKNLVEQKLGILDKIKQLNSVRNNPQKQFNELYSQLEKTEIDTVQVKVEVVPAKKKGFFNKIFGKKDTVTIRIDTSFVEKTVVDEEIKEDILLLESDVRQREQQKNRIELRLIEQNIQVSARLNQIITQIEKTERDKLIAKKEEADRLAKIIYERLSVFSIIAVLLLFVVLYLFVRYLQRARNYQRVLTEAKQETERLAAAKEVFIANVSHEMRNPVNSIYGLTEQLFNQASDNKTKQHLSVLLKSAEHLKNVVNDTLDLSKIQAKKLKLESVDFSPENVVKEVLDLFKPEADKKNIKLTCQCRDSLPKALLGDPFRLKQILINTLGNAVKFTEKGSVSLELEAQEFKKDFYLLQFHVKDTGIGISEENLELIFEDFVQVASDYKKKSTGTGLGLSIVRKLIEMQDGKIKIESELNRGTQLSFTLPFKVGNPENISHFIPSEIVIPEKVRNLKILGVDDEEFNRYLLKVIFEKWGVDYREAKNGREAVKLASEQQFDLILMDVLMPEMNGIEAAGLILENNQNALIVAVSAVNSESEIELFNAAGMHYFLLKPFSEQELFSKITSVLKINVDKESGVDFPLNDLESITGGDNEFLKEMIRIFIRSSQSGIKNIRQNQNENNWDAVSEAAHKLAAPCKHIGASDLYVQIKKLEKCAGNRELLESMPELILWIEHKIDEINNSLTSILDSGKYDT